SPDRRDTGLNDRGWPPHRSSVRREGHAFLLASTHRVATSSSVTASACTTPPALPRSSYVEGRDGFGSARTRDWPLKTESVDSTDRFTSSSVNASSPSSYRRRPARSAN